MLRMNLFSVARRVSGDLCGFMSLETVALQIFAYLLAAGAGGVKILLRVAPDLRCAAASRLSFVPKRAEPVGQLRLVDGSGELLALKQTLRLQSAMRAVFQLRHVEDDSVGMELRSGVPVNGTCGVVLELRCNELAGRLCRTVPTHACLRVTFELIQGEIDGVPVGFAHSIIAPYKSCYRYRLC